MSFDLGSVPGLWQWASQAADLRQGDALPASLRQAMEHLFQTDFSDVRIRPWAALDPAGLSALCWGRHVLFAQRCWQPGDPAFAALLAHELAHVVQARRAALRGHTRDEAAGLRIELDVALEDEADQAAACAMGHLPSSAMPSALLAVPGQLGASCAVARPKITIEEDGRIYAHTNGLVRYIKYYSAAKLLTKLKATQSYQDHQQHVDEVQLAEVLKRWCDAPRKPSELNIITGFWQESQNKRFPDYETLAIAAIGEVMSLPHRRQEQALARDVVSSTAYKEKLQEFVSQVLDYHRDKKGKYAQAGVDRVDSESGRYWWYYRPLLIGGTHGLHKQSIISALTYQKNHLRPVSEMVSALADYSMLSRYIYGDLKSQRFFRKDDERLKKVMKSRGTHYTINETGEWSQSARDNLAPTGAGPSATTMNVMALLEAVAHHNDSLSKGKIGIFRNALAWGLFAFWNQTADKLRGEIHTFHEVMSVATRWGVSYIGFQYPEHIPDLRLMEAIIARRNPVLDDDDSEDDDDNDDI
ncbi:MAG TPA: DUF4157 domain-containing protein [Pseudomonadota bacterium]|nr:DUF4157 domain-containing protein [Pseudomonadota bacterium]